jgi:hypothetical protein
MGKRTDTEHGDEVLSASFHVAEEPAGRATFEEYIHQQPRGLGWALALWCDGEPEKVRHAYLTWTRNRRVLQSSLALFAWWRETEQDVQWIAIPLAWIEDSPWLCEDAAEVLHADHDLPADVMHSLKIHFGYEVTEVGN